MKQEEKVLQNKTLYDLFRDALKFENADGYDGWYYYDNYVGYRKKYIQSLMTMSEVMIHDVSMELSSLNLDPNNAQITQDTLLIVTNRFRKISDDAFDGLLKILNEHINFNNIKDIQGYTEFDILEWDIDERGKVKIKFKPKGKSVSFWHADPNKIQMK